MQQIKEMNRVQMQKDRELQAAQERIQKAEADLKRKNAEAETERALLN